MIKRDNLRKGDTIAYSVPGSEQILHGEIVHIGLGLAARNAVWIRCTDGYSTGLISYVMLTQIIGVVTYSTEGR